MRRLLGAAVTALAALMVPVPAAAMPNSTDSDPARLPAGVVVDPPPGAEVTWPPRYITVSFPEEVPSGVVAVLRDGDGLTYPPAVPLRTEGRILAFAPPQLAGGSYTLSWDGPLAGSSAFNLVMGEQDPQATTGTGSLWWRGLLLPAGASAGMAAAAVLARGRRRVAVLLFAAAPVPVLIAALVLPTQGSEPFDRCVGLSRGPQLDCLVSSFDDLAPAEVNANLALLKNEPQFDFGYGQDVCHEVAHEAARRRAVLAGSALEVIEGIDATCSSGFIHGAIEGAARIMDTDAFRGEFAALCRTRPGISEDDLRECSHGLGHAASFRLNSRLELTLDLCATLEPGPYRDECVEGAGMSSGEWFANMAARSVRIEDALPDGATSLDDLFRTCFESDLGFEPSAVRSCWAGLMIMYSSGVEDLAVLGPFRTPGGVVDWCAANAGPWAEECFFGAGAGSAYRRAVPASELLKPCTRAGTAGVRPCMTGGLAKIMNSTAGDGPLSPALLEACAAVPDGFADVCDEVIASGGKLPV